MIHRLSSRRSTKSCSTQCCSKPYAPICIFKSYFREICTTIYDTGFIFCIQMRKKRIWFRWYITTPAFKRVCERTYTHSRTLLQHILFKAGNLYHYCTSSFCLKATGLDEGFLFHLTKAATEQIESVLGAPQELFPISQMLPASNQRRVLFLLSKLADLTRRAGLGNVMGTWTLLPEWAKVSNWATFNYRNFQAIKHTWI